MADQDGGNVDIQTATTQGISTESMTSATSGSATEITSTASTDSVNEQSGDASSPKPTTEWDVEKSVRELVADADAAKVAEIAERVSRAVLNIVAPLVENLGSIVANLDERLQRLEAAGEDVEADASSDDTEAEKAGAVGREEFTALKWAVTGLQQRLKHF